MLTASELSDMRSVQNQALPGTAIVERYTLVSDGMMGQTESWSAVATVNVRLYPYSSRANSEGLAGDQIIAQTRWYVTLPYGTDVDEKDRLSIAGNIYDVVEVNTAEMYQTAVRCEVEYNPVPVT